MRLKKYLALFSGLIILSGIATAMDKEEEQEVNTNTTHQFNEVKQENFYLPSFTNAKTHSSTENLISQIDKTNLERSSKFKRKCSSSFTDKEQEQANKIRKAVTTDKEEQPTNTHQTQQINNNTERRNHFDKLSLPLTKQLLEYLDSPEDKINLAKAHYSRDRNITNLVKNETQQIREHNMYDLELPVDRKSLRCAPLQSFSFYSENNPLRLKITNDGTNSPTIIQALRKLNYGQSVQPNNGLLDELDQGIEYTHVIINQKNLNGRNLTDPNVLAAMLSYEIEYAETFDFSNQQTRDALQPILSHLITKPGMNHLEIYDSITGNLLDSYIAIKIQKVDNSRKKMKRVDEPKKPIVYIDTTL